MTLLTNPISPFVLPIAITFGLSFLALIHRCVALWKTGLTPLSLAKAPDFPLPLPILVVLILWAFLLRLIFPTEIVFPFLLVVILFQPRQMEKLWEIRYRDFNKYLVSGGMAGLAATIPLLLFFTICEESLKTFGIKVAPQAILSGLDPAKGPSTVLLTLYKAILLAPFFEELLFRGILYPLAKMFLNRWVAAFLISFVFALAHRFPPGIPALVLMGMFLTILYEKNGSLGYSIVAHSVYNAMGCCIFLAWQKL